MKVQAYYHKKTGLLFLDKNEYKVHLCMYKARQNFIERRDIRINRIKALIEQAPTKYGSVESIVDFISENFADIAEYAVFSSGKYVGSRLQQVKLRQKIRKIKVLRTHVDGFSKKNKFVNSDWRNKKKDEKYGWGGTIQIIVSDDLDWPIDFFDILKTVGIVVGSGNASNIIDPAFDKNAISYRYETVFYEEVWYILAIMAKMRNGNAKNDECFDAYEDEDEDQY